MVTAKKPAAKKTAKASVQPTAKPPVQPEEFRMPTEVKDWIERAESIMRNMQSKIDRLTEENVELKSYKRWAEQRILNSTPE
jgi:hypothetical protein